MTRWLRATRVAGLAVGAAAASAGVALAVQKIAVGRIRLRPDPEVGQPFGQLRGRTLTVLADDGVALHAEINGPDEAPGTIIFCHGYALNQDVWHYQRAGLAEAARLVFWDQRSHGKSGRSDPGRVSIDQLGADLHTVLMATTPGDSPVVLVGHSMGGMTIMALADQYPGLFGGKVVGVVLISTAARGVDPAAWLPAPLRPVARQTAPVLLRGVQGRAAAVIERSRAATGDLGFLGTRLIAFGDSRASPAVVDFLERMVRATQVEVIADFYLALLGHDKLDAVGVLGKVPVLVLSGQRDRLMPQRFSDEVAQAIPGAEHVVVPGTGHVSPLETPELVNAAISDLAARAFASRSVRRRGRSARRRGRPGLAVPASKAAPGPARPGQARPGQAAPGAVVPAQASIPTATAMRAFGARLAALLRPGDLVVLTGPLGAGKTTLVQGIGAGLGVRGPVTSPTFVIARTHPSLRDGPALVHADAYRLGSRAEVDDLDLDADLDRSVTVVEWGDGLVDDLAASVLEITISMPDPAGPPGAPGAAGPDPADEPRFVRLVGRGERWESAAESARLVRLVDTGPTR